MRTVDNALKLQQAIMDGVYHIIITDHLDATDLSPSRSGVSGNPILFLIGSDTTTSIIQVRFKNPSKLRSERTPSRSRRSDAYAADGRKTCPACRGIAPSHFKHPRSPKKSRLPHRCLSSSRSSALSSQMKC
jgi:hypothetical protein